MFLFWYSLITTTAPTSSLRIRNRWKSAMKRIPEIHKPVAPKSQAVTIPSPKTPHRPSTAAGRVTSSKQHGNRSPILSSSPARKITFAVSPATSTERLTSHGEHTRNRSSSFGQYYRQNKTMAHLDVPDQYLGRQRSSSFGQQTSTQMRLHKKQTKINLDLPVKKSTSTNSLHSSSESLCDHKNDAIKRKDRFKELSKPSDLVFDHLHGEIRHKIKAAFGSTVHDEFKLQVGSTDMNERPSSKSSTTLDGESPEQEDTVAEPIAADKFINQCIIEAQTTIIRPTEKARASSLFSQVMEELLPTHDDEIQLSDLKPLETPRERAYSVPAAWRQHRKTVPCGMRLQIEQDTENLTWDSQSLEVGSLRPNPQSKTLRISHEIYLIVHVMWLEVYSKVSWLDKT